MLGNPGFGRTTNVAATHASGSLLLVLNPDTELLDEDALRSFVAAFHDAPPDCGVYSPMLRTEDGDDRACARSLPTLRNVAAHYGVPFVRSDNEYSISDLPPSGLERVGAVNGAFMLMNAAFYNQLGGFDERFWMYAEDLDPCARVKEAGKNVYLDIDQEVRHSKGGTTGSVRSPRVAWAFCWSMIQYFSKHERGIGIAPGSGVNHPTCNTSPRWS
ncbi:MAG: GT2 family glycosyltransferase [Verrucomicrobiales bacterium]|jgi:GT2 family glycosyltransferase